MFICKKKSVALAATVVSLAASCGTNPEQIENTGSTPLATQGPYISANEVRSYVRQAGFPESLVETLVDIAWCESSFGAGSYAYGGGNRHTGIFQISDLHKSACGYGAYSLDTFRAKMTAPGLNAQCAYTVYVNAGYSLTP